MLSALRLDAPRGLRLVAAVAAGPTGSSVSWKWCVRFFRGHPRAGLLDPAVILFHFRRTLQAASTEAASFYTPASGAQGSRVSMSSALRLLCAMVAPEL